MAQHSRKPLPPRRSLPPLSFGDPELDNLIANDNHPTAPPPPPSVPPPRNSLSGLTFGSVPPPARRPGARASAVPARASAAPSAEVDAILGAIPSIPPEPTVDPSFAQAKDPSFASAPPPPPRVAAPPPPPPPWHVALGARFHAGVDALVERLPAAPAALGRLPPQVAVGVTLVALWFQLGLGVRWLRALIRLLGAL